MTADPWDGWAVLDPWHFGQLLDHVSPFRARGRRGRDRPFLRQVHLSIDDGRAVMLASDSFAMIEATAPGGGTFSGWFDPRGLRDAVYAAHSAHRRAVSIVGVAGGVEVTANGRTTFCPTIDAPGPSAWDADPRKFFARFWPEDRQPADSIALGIDQLVRFDRMPRSWVRQIRLWTARDENEGITNSPLMVENAENLGGPVVWRAVVMPCAMPGTKR